MSYSFFNMRHLVSGIYSKSKALEKKKKKKAGGKASQLSLPRPTEMPPTELHEKSESRADKQPTGQQLIPSTFFLLYSVPCTSPKHRLLG